MGKANILIVEDEAVVAAELAEKLERLGFRVAATTAPGEAAVTLARELRPDLVLMGGRSAERMMQDALEAERQAAASNSELFAETAERRRSGEALRRSNERLNLLAATAGRLLVGDEPQALVEAVCHQVMPFLDCQAFFNFLVDERLGCLTLNACAGIPAEEAESIRHLEYGVAVCGCAARDACRIVAEDIPASDDPRVQLVKSYGIRAYACHPLMAHGRVLGTLSFGTRTRDGFSAEDLSLMKAVADQVAIAMERKRSEEELRQAKRAAEAASRTKSRFLANMSHELRTPMSGVLGMLELALESCSESQRTAFIGTALRSGWSLMRILNDILDLSKVESGKFALDEGLFSVADCLHQTVELLMPEAGRKGLKLDCRVCGEPPEWLIGDGARLRQVLLNLAANAVKFTDAGRVVLEASAGPRLPGGKLALDLSVSDTGIGVPAEKQALIFDYFSQADDSNTRSYGGTGLGLALSKELVERMGGSISLASTEGEGCTVSFTVPVGVPEAAGQAAGQEAAADASAPFPPETPVKAPGGRLLIAEDDPTIRQVLGGMLERMHYRVDFAVDGATAVSMWQERDYDVILMDVQMPKLDGFLATASIRELERERGGHVPIVAMTAHVMKGDEQRCIAMGMDGYLAKPIDFKTLLARLQTYCG